MLVLGGGVERLLTPTAVLAVLSTLYLVYLLFRLAERQDFAASSPSKRPIPGSSGLARHLLPISSRGDRTGRGDGTDDGTLRQDRTAAHRRHRGVRGPRAGAGGHRRRPRAGSGRLHRAAPAERVAGHQDHRRPTPRRR